MLTRAGGMQQVSCCLETVCFSLGEDSVQPLSRVLQGSGWRDLPSLSFRQATDLGKSMYKINFNKGQTGNYT